MAKILIIEDEKAIRNVLSNILIEEDKNHEVDTAENGLDGFEMLTQNTYDLVLCDIKMPKMDGVIRESDGHSARHSHSYDFRSWRS